MTKLENIWVLVAGVLVGCGGQVASAPPVAMPPPAPVAYVPQVVVVEDPRTVRSDVGLDCRNEREQAERVWRAYVDAVGNEFAHTAGVVSALEEGLAEASVLTLEGIRNDAARGGIDVGPLDQLVGATRQELPGLRQDVERLHRAVASGDVIRAMEHLQTIMAKTLTFVRAAGGVAQATRHIPRSPETEQWMEAMRRISARAEDEVAQVEPRAQAASAALTADGAVRTNRIAPWDAFSLIPIGANGTDPIASVRTRAAQARSQCGGARGSIAAAW
jgi:hypothetical protein